MTEDLVTTFNISLVVRGSVSETGIADEDEQKRYSIPKEKGIMRCFRILLCEMVKGVSVNQGLKGCAGRQLKHKCCTACMHSTTGMSEHV